MFTLTSCVPNEIIYVQLYVLFGRLESTLTHNTMATVGAVVGPDYSKYISQMSADHMAGMTNEYDKLYGGMPCYNTPLPSAGYGSIQVGQAQVTSQL